MTEVYLYPTPLYMVLCVTRNYSDDGSENKAQVDMM